MEKKIVISRKPGMTEEEFKEAFNIYQTQRRKIVLYGLIRRKAMRRASSLLRRNHSSEYKAYLNRFTVEFKEQWENKEKERIRKEVTHA